MPVRFIPLSAKREELSPRRFRLEYVEAIMDDDNREVTFVRTHSGGVHESFTISIVDLDEFYAEYDAHVTGDPRPATGSSPEMIDARGVAFLQRPLPEH